MKRTALACLSMLLLLPMLTFFTPCSQAADAPTEADKQEALERLQLLKQQLIELKEELAKVKAEKAREARAATVTSGDPIWKAMPGLDQHPGDYGLYGYVLITPRTLPQDAIALLTLLETGPGSQAEKTINSTIFVVPADDKDGRIMIDNYKEVLATRLLKSSKLADATGPVLLLTVDPFTDGMPDHSLGIDLGSQKAASIKTILEVLLQPQPIDEDPLNRFRELAWQLADSDEKKNTVITSKGPHLRIHWTR